LVTDEENITDIHCAATLLDRRRPLEYLVGDLQVQAKTKLRSLAAAASFRTRFWPGGDGEAQKTPSASVDLQERLPTKQGCELVDGLSVDLEDYYHVEAFAEQISRSRWSVLPSRIRQNTQRTLALLERSRCRATFFVLGWVAEREPGLIRELAEAGHELACHSHLHRRLHTLTPSQFRDDVRRSRDAIEHAGGIKLVGFRAPSFSITCNSLWALQVLAEERFEYDSSIFPIRHDLYGIPNAPRWAHRRRLPSGQTIWEIPPSTVRIGRANLPVAGGGSLRLFPRWFTRWAIERIHQRDGQPVIVYFHPWELDPDQPRLRGSWKSRFRHYTGLNKTEGRLQEILSHGDFQPLINLVRRLESFPPTGVLNFDDRLSAAPLCPGDSSVGELTS
jgi:polysaccharide deacetylase family protein (PEP-CTERM system associated)